MTGFLNSHLQNGPGTPHLSMAGRSRLRVLLRDFGCPAEADAATLAAGFRRLAKEGGGFAFANGYGMCVKGNYLFKEKPKEDHPFGAPKFNTHMRESNIKKNTRPFSTLQPLPVWESISNPRSGTRTWLCRSGSPGKLQTRSSRSCPARRFVL